MSKVISNGFTTLALVAALCFIAPPAQSDSGEKYSLTVESHRRIHQHSAVGNQDHSYHSLPISVGNEAHITISAPTSSKHLIPETAQALATIHQRIKRVVGPTPTIDLDVQFMNESAFFSKTKAPTWANAIYYNQSIILPLKEDHDHSIGKFHGALEHEYSHAVTHALTKGRCPAWFDEGLALVIEGQQSKRLRKALLNWLRKNPTIPFSKLEKGFTGLDREAVPAAYAQSSVAVQSLVSNYGYTAVSSYLSALGMGEKHERAFEASFGVTEAAFENAIKQQLADWAWKHRYIR